MTWIVRMIALWQHALKPSQSCLQLTDKLCTTMREEIERARRHEESGLAGDHVNAMCNDMCRGNLDRAPSEPAAPQNRFKDKRSGG